MIHKTLHRNQRLSNTNPTKNRGLTHVLRKRHSCWSTSDTRRAIVKPREHYLIWKSSLKQVCVNNTNYIHKTWTSTNGNLIGGVMVSVLASSAIEHDVDPRSGQTVDCTIGKSCFSATHAAFRRKSKDWLARNKNNVSEWSDMSTRWLLFQWASTLKIQLRPHHHLIGN